MTPRILFQFRGGEIELFRYKRAVPIQQATEKLQKYATEIFPSWEWAKDGDVPAIEALESENMLLLVEGPSGRDCFL